MRCREQAHMTGVSEKPICANKCEKQPRSLWWVGVWGGSSHCVYHSEEQACTQAGGLRVCIHLFK